MHFLRSWTWLISAIAMLMLSACGAAPQTAAPMAPFIKPGPLSNMVNYWDLGLSIKYPDNWLEPAFSDGQMVLATSAQAFHGQSILQPVVSVRILDPERDLRLGKNATLEQIAIAAGSSSNVKVGQRLAVKVAGLDASAVNLSDTASQLYSQMVAFRLPDGRTATIVGVAPVDVWADFAPTFDQMRSAAALLKPADFPRPPLESSGSHPQGGITFQYPKGWVEKVESGNVRVYRSPDTSEYVDNSGFVNGPHLVVIVQAFPKGSTLQAALTNVANLRRDDVLTNVAVGNASGMQAIYVDSLSGQVVTFTAVQSPDQAVLIVFRWTVPGILDTALRPQLNGILKSAIFGTINATLVSLPTRAGSQLTPTALGMIGPTFYAGLPQSRLPDGGLVLGASSAPVHVVSFTDFGCAPCNGYERDVHQLIDSYVRQAKVRLEIHYLAMSDSANGASGVQYATTAAYAALCAGEQSKEMEIRDRLFAIQLEHGSTYYSSDNLAKEAQSIGLDGAALKRCIDSGKYANVLTAASKLASDLSVRSLPTALIAKGNDAPRFVYAQNQPVVAPPYVALAQVIEQLVK